MGGWQALIISNMARFAWVSSFVQQLVSMIRSGLGVWLGSGSGNGVWAKCTLVARCDK